MREGTQTIAKKSIQRTEENALKTADRQLREIEKVLGFKLDDHNSDGNERLADWQFNLIFSALPHEDKLYYLAVEQDSI